MMGVRKVLDHFFEPHELKILDDILPEFKRHEKLDDEEGLELGVSFPPTYLFFIFSQTNLYNSV